MGLFDYIKYETHCPLCNTFINDFQSKDSKCMMEIIDFKLVNRFYTICNECGLWIEYNKNNNNVFKYSEKTKKQIYKVKSLIKNCNDALLNLKHEDIKIRVYCKYILGKNDI